jgi:hypothetical protein
MREKKMELIDELRRAIKEYQKQPDEEKFNIMNDMTKKLVSNHKVTSDI